jgi:hypothetical protein
MERSHHEGCEFAMRLPYLLVAALVVIAPGAHADDADAVTRRHVAVVPAAGNAPPALRDAVSGIVLETLGGLAGLRVQPIAETRAVLATMQGLGLACDARVDRDRCALRIGGLAGVDVVIASDVEQIDDVAVVRLAAFDVARQRPLGTAQVVRLAPTGPAATTTAATRKDQPKPPLVPLGPVHRRELGLAVIRLVAPEQERGLLAITVEAGTAVVIDGVPRGIAPLSGPLALSPGRHELWVGRIGRVSQTHSVDVIFDETTRVELSLDPDETVGTADRPLALPAVPTAPSVRRIAVYDVEAAGLPTHLPALAQSALTIELRKLEGVVVVSMDEIRTLLTHEANRQLASCSDDTGCLAGIADALGADTIVTVQLAMIEGQSVYGARRLDTAGLTAATTVQERLKPDEGRELIAVTGRIVEQLFPDLPLRDGASRGPGRELIMRASPPPLPPAVFLGVTGTAVLAAGATAALGAVNLATVSALRTEDDGAARKAAIASLPTSATGFWVGLGVTVVAAAGAGVTALFTDWEPTP